MPTRVFPRGAGSPIYRLNFTALRHIPAPDRPAGGAA